MKNGTSADKSDGCDGCHIVMEGEIEWRTKRENIEKIADYG